MQEFNSRLENVKQLLNSQSRQNWLFGAGISFGSKIPLMYPLTTRVEKVIGNESSEKEKEILASLKADLNNDCHVEHYLSHLGDLLAIAERSKDKVAHIGGNGYTSEQLKSEDLINSAINDRLKLIKEEAIFRFTCSFALVLNRIMVPACLHSDSNVLA